ncbi:MAG: hypothetical protein ACOYIQ_04780 [Christensenellales bacterium]|jgi:fluoroquinolone transport system permease protein
MNNIVKLIKGEVIRLYKYKILVVGSAVSLLWALILGLIPKENAVSLLPILLFMDASVMSILLLAASFYLEKQEGSLKTLLVTTVGVGDILIAKVAASLINGLISGVIVAVSAMIIHKIQINLLLLFCYLLIVVAAHSAIGFVIILFCKDFGSVIVFYALFALVAIIPSFLLSLGVIPRKFNDILLFSPSHSGQVLINSVVAEVKVYQIAVAIAYLLILTAILYRFVVYKKFKQYAVEG